MIVMLANLLVTWSIGHSLAHSLNQSVTRSIIHPVFQHVILPVNLWVLVCIHPSYLVVWVGTLEFDISPISPTKNSEHKSSNLPILPGLCGAELGRSFGVSLLQVSVFFCGWVFNWPIRPLAVLLLEQRLFFWDFKSTRSNVSSCAFRLVSSFFWSSGMSWTWMLIFTRFFPACSRTERWDIWAKSARFHEISWDWSRLDASSIWQSLSSSFIPRCWWCKGRVSEIHPFIQKWYRTLWSVASIQFWNFWPSGCFFFGGSGGDHQSATSANCSPGVGSLADDRLFKKTGVDFFTASGAEWCWPWEFFLIPQWRRT